MRAILRTTLLAVALLGCHRSASLHGLGATQPGQLCPDGERCDARGDVARSTLHGRKARPIYLADGQGPESYLGKVAPDRKAEGALMTCGGDVTKEDWFETAPTLRTLELTDEGKRELRATLRAHVAQEISANLKVLEGTDATLEAAVESAALGLNIKKVAFTSQTYWLKDAAFERRVGQCGDEHYPNIIYSITLLRLSDLMHKELESRIVEGLETRLTSRRLPVVKPSSAEAQPGSDDGVESTPADTQSSAPRDPQAAAEEARRVLIAELAYRAVHALANELRVVAAFGYDEQ